jgi:hypothetical protein
MAERLLRRETRYGVWEQKRPLIGARYWFGTENKSYRELPRKWWIEAKERSDSEAVKLHEHNGKAWWRYKDDLFTGRANLSAADVTALAAQMQRGKDKAIERAHAELRGEEAAVHHREPIPESVRHEVWRRDRGRCVDCGSRERLELDHIVPVSKGGSNTARNIELRCAPCNARKSDRI